MSDVRLSLAVTAEMDEAIEAMAKRYSTSKNEILRKAVVLMAVASNAKAHDQKLGIVDAKTGGLVTEIVGL